MPPEAIKLVIVGGRAPGKTREEAHRHMRAVHGPMVYAPPPDAGPMPSAYMQNPAFDDDGALPPAWRGARDFVTEIGFENFAHLAAATSTPYYLERLRPDEPHFVDLPSVRAAPTRAERSTGAQGVEAARLFVFLKQTNASETLARALAHAHEAAEGAVNGAQSDVALPGPGGRAPPFDRVERLSFESRAAALAFARARFADFVAPLAPYIDPAQSFAVLAEPWSVARMKAHAEALA